VAIGVSVPIYEGGALRNRTEAVRIDTARRPRPRRRSIECAKAPRLHSTIPAAFKAAPAFALSGKPPCPFGQWTCCPDGAMINRVTLWSVSQAMGRSADAGLFTAGRATTLFIDSPGHTDAALTRRREDSDPRCRFFNNL